MKLVTPNATFDLFKSAYDKFWLTQKEPYPMEHRLVRDTVIGPNGVDNFNTYEYRCIVIDGEFYGFKKEGE